MFCETGWAGINDDSTTHPRRKGAQFLNASLTDSPASLTLDLLWSFLPSPSRSLFIGSVAQILLRRADNVLGLVLQLIDRTHNSNLPVSYDGPVNDRPGQRRNTAADSSAVLSWTRIKTGHAREDGP